MNAKSKGKVLFLYPNSEGYGGIPNGLALLAGCLKAAGFESRCFDTTFFNAPPKTFFQRQKHGGMMQADYRKAWGEWSPELREKAPGLFIETVEEYKPDLVAVSITEVCYDYAISLLTSLRKHSKVPVIAGGITATVSPELIIQNECIDMVCVGEGEEALVEVAKSIVGKQDYDRIRNLWVRRGGKIIRNPLRPLKDMNTIPFQDWSLFDERHVYKPYMGEFRRTAFIEFARGCHFNCTYCCTASLRHIYKGLGSFMRTRDVDKTLDEVADLHQKHDLELILFTDDDFLGMPKERLSRFCNEYKRRVNLPFYIQTRCETVREESLVMLKEANVSTIAIGVEHGNEEFRKRCMNRRMRNEDLKRAFDLIHKAGIRSTANLIIGTPGEDEKLFADTVKLMRELKPKSYSINFLMPFRGTAIREVAVKEGLIPPDHLIRDSNTCLDLPGFRKERLIHCYENFKKYLEGELEIKED